MKSILILYNKDSWDIEQPKHTPAQKLGYSVWGQICQEKNIKLSRASFQWFNTEKKFFDKHWQYDNGKWLKKENNKFLPTVIYDKTRNYDFKTIEYLPECYKKKLRIAACCPIINYPEMTNFLDHKLNQVLVFNKHMPNAKVVEKGEEYLALKDSPVVLKNFFGSGGKQVQIITKGKVKIEQRMLKQEFIKAKKQGVLKDVRLVFIGDQVQFGLSRIAKQDCLFTNFHQGASIRFLDLKDYQDLIKKALAIAKPLQVFPKRIFALDFLFDAETGKEYLIEINTKPGLDVFDEKSKPILKKYLSNLTDYLLK